MRHLLLTLLIATPAFAQLKIGGTLTGSYEGLVMSSPRVRVEIALTCSLVCDQSMPLLSYRMRAGIASFYDKSPSEATGYTAYPTVEIQGDGQDATLTDDMRVGTVNVLIARGVTCECGTMLNQGGQIDLYSEPFAIPPLVAAPDSVRVDGDLTITIGADPRGSERVDVLISGGGIDELVQLYPSDFVASGAYVSRKPKAATPVTITASLHGAAIGVATVRNVTITPKAVTPDAGRPMGGGTGGGGGEMASCSAVGFVPLSFAALFFARRRRRS